MRPYKIPTRISLIISDSRFPLMVMVVLIHAKLNCNKSFPIYEILEFTISDFVCRIAVPLFYLISGYLFFVNSSLSFSSLILKLKRRIYSVLIPYLLWNFIIILIFIVAELLLPSFRSGLTKPILQYNLFDFICAFWDTNLINHIPGNGEPICFQFWFLRDLMISMLVMPLIIITIKSKIMDILIGCCLGILWLKGVTIEIPGFSIVSFFFFYTGLLLYKYHVDLKKILTTKITITFTIIYLCLYGLSISKTPGDWLNISIIIGIIIFENFIKLFDQNKNTQENQFLLFLSQSSFFLYAAHGIIITFLVKFSVAHLPQNDLLFSLMYLINPVLTVFICEGMYYGLKKTCPRLESILSGSR